MGLGGLIAGALGGAAKGYVETSQSELRKQQSLDLQKQMMAMEEEKQLRMDEIRRNRDITQKKREIEEIDPLKANSDANRTRVVGRAETDVLQGREDALRPGRVATATAMGEAETGVLAGREEALRPGKVATGKAMGEAQGEVERGNLAKYGSDPAARSGARAKAQDSATPPIESPTAVANRKWEEEIRGLRRELADLPADSPRAQELQRKISVMQGSATAKGDSLAQQVAAARTVLSDMDSTEDQKATARQFLNLALSDGVTKRGGANPGGGPKEGDRSKSKSGKDIIYRNGQWEYL